VPKQNRPLVRDGRLQSSKKKRTDRSYLRPASASPSEPVEEEQLVAAELAEAEEASEPSMPVEPTDVFRAEPQTMAEEPRAMPSVRATGTVRALQQQGVRKRREVDIALLQRRDSDYALHELRRIFVLAAMVVITLVVLTIVLR
jgi:hypothetical protein